MADEKRFTKDDLRVAFTDGVTAGIASQIGTFGDEDFMGGEAAVKAEGFIKKENRGFYETDWEDLWAYCGGASILDPDQKYTCGHTGSDGMDANLRDGEWYTEAGILIPDGGNVCMCTACCDAWEKAREEHSTKSGGRGRYKVGSTQFRDKLAPFEKESGIKVEEVCGHVLAVLEFPSLKPTPLWTQKGNVLLCGQYCDHPNVLIS
jgi:hypothetical protein